MEKLRKLIGSIFWKQDDKYHRSNRITGRKQKLHIETITRLYYGDI